MKFKLEVMRGALAAGLAVVLLASCGGSSEIDPFVPQRIVVFGDETSLVLPDGRKYSVNAATFDTDPSGAPTNPHLPLNCNANLVWTQQLAGGYGFAFDGCPASGNPDHAVMRAEVDKKAADISTQVTAFLSTGSFSNSDLVTVMVGMHDVIGLYESMPNPVANQDALIAVARQAGTEVGAQVVRITDLGAKVLVSTIPNMGLSPYAAAKEGALPGSAALLSALSEKFNIGLQVKLQDVRDGGHAVGLVLTEDLVSSMYSFPSLYGLTNWTGAVCSASAPLPNCDQTTLNAVPAAPNYGYDWLWADDRHLGANAQARIGGLAATRAHDNPF